jgi:hypothetical protein
MVRKRVLSVLLSVLFIPSLSAFGQEIKMSVTVKAESEGKFRFTGDITCTNLYPKGQLRANNNVSVQLEYIDSGGKFRTLPEYMNIRYGPAKNKKILTKEQEHGVKAKAIGIFRTGLGTANEGKPVKFDIVTSVPFGAGAYRIVATLTHSWSGTWTAIIYKHDVFSTSPFGKTVKVTRVDPNGQGTGEPPLIPDDAWEDGWPMKPTNLVENLMGEGPGILPGIWKQKDAEPGSWLPEGKINDTLVTEDWMDTLNITGLTPMVRDALTPEEIAAALCAYSVQLDQACEGGYTVACFAMDWIVTKYPWPAPISVPMNCTWAFIKAYGTAFMKTDDRDTAWLAAKNAVSKKIQTEGVCLLIGKSFGSTMNDIYGKEAAKWVGYGVKNWQADILTDYRLGQDTQDTIDKFNNKKQPPSDSTPTIGKTYPGIWFRR